MRPFRMRILGIIPARAGSTRIANKNIRVLGGRPLIEWTIEAAHNANCLGSLIVSTDSEEIAATARSAGADVPWLRSKLLATETADVVDAVLEVLERIELSGSVMPDGVLLLQPTSPFRTSDSIRGACEAFAQGCGRSVVSVRPARDHPAWCKTIDEQGYIQLAVPENRVSQRSQDLPPVYAINGAIYISTPKTLRSERSFYSAQTIAFVMHSQIEGLDIDTPDDWMIAEAFVNARRVPEDAAP